MTESDSKTHLAFQLRFLKKRTNHFGTYKNDIRKRLETKQNSRDSSHEINIHQITQNTHNTLLNCPNPSLPNKELVKVCFDWCLKIIMTLEAKNQSFMSYYCQTGKYDTCSSSKLLEGLVLKSVSEKRMNIGSKYFLKSHMC